jgi:hypothetical protein
MALKWIKHKFSNYQIMNKINLFNNFIHYNKYLMTEVDLFLKIIKIWIIHKNLPINSFYSSLKSIILLIFRFDF